MLENPGRVAGASRRLPWMAVIAWMLVIYALSAQSNLPSLTPGFPSVQEFAGHAGEYAVLVLLLRWALSGSGARHADWWALTIAVIYAFGDEFHQSFVPGRTADLKDVATDVVGAALSLFVAYRLRRRHGPHPRLKR